MCYCKATHVNVKTAGMLSLNARGRCLASVQETRKLTVFTNGVHGLHSVMARERSQSSDTATQKVCSISLALQWHAQALSQAWATAWGRRAPLNIARQVGHGAAKDGQVGQRDGMLRLEAPPQDVQWHQHTATANATTCMASRASALLPLLCCSDTPDVPMYGRRRNYVNFAQVSAPHPADGDMQLAHNRML